MEIVRAYESGEEWQLSKSELKELSAANLIFEKMPFERELIAQFFKSESQGSGYVEHLTATQIKTYIENSTHQKIINMTRFGIELKFILGEAIFKRHNGVFGKFYSCIKIDTLNTQTVDNQPDPF